jgi:3-hydroxybutyrate dehydrogenase
MLKGKTAVVTGSTSGIGLGMAKALAAEGCNIVLNGFGDAKEIEALRRDLQKKAGVKATYSAADMSKPAEIAAMIAEAQAHFGAVDILVNNAGIQHVSPVESFPADKWDQIITINLTAVFHGIRAALPGMRAKGWGRIVNIASVHGLVASIHKAAYVAAKHGVIGLTKVVALEAAGQGITCNAICPGWVLTPLVAKQIETRAQEQGMTFDEAKIDLVQEKQPSKDFVTTEQIGAMTCFLCSDSAAQITGVALNIDGGWLAQ